MKIARDFTKDTEMIVMEVRWEDRDGVQRVVDAINQRTIISDNEGLKLPSVLDELEADLTSLDEEDPLRAIIEAIATHIDYVKQRRGRLLNDHDMRQGWKEFAGELADEALGKNPPDSIKILLSGLKGKAQELNVD